MYNGLPVTGSGILAFGFGTMFSGLWIGVTLAAIGVLVFCLGRLFLAERKSLE